MPTKIKPIYTKGETVEMNVTVTYKNGKEDTWHLYEWYENGLLLIDNDDNEYTTEEELKQLNIVKVEMDSSEWNYHKWEDKTEKRNT